MSGLDNSLTKDDFEVNLRSHNDEYKAIVIQASNSEYPKRVMREILENQKLRKIIEAKIKELKEMDIDEWTTFNPEIDEFLEELLNQAKKEII